MYGGGNLAGVIGDSLGQNADTTLIIIGGTITGNVYGGGNEGVVLGNTHVNVKDATVLGCIYAGGNGVSATVFGNSEVYIHGNTIVGTDLGEGVNILPSMGGSVFGGGNAAATGETAIETSESIVNIVGGSIWGNVYGGANTSVIYGYATVNIGMDAVNEPSLIESDIFIRGTIFGGGEANASGSETYDFYAISVTKGIEININGTGYEREEFITEGSIFGSGNASSSAGTSEIFITNFGTIDSPQRNISIQRTDLVILDNSSMVLNGARDRTNEIATAYFALSRIDELLIKNNSVLYLNYGANLVKTMSSLDEHGQIGYVTIEEDEETEEIKIESNVDNRIYLRETRNLNIATVENVNAALTGFGDINGMFFLGLYTSEYSPIGSTGLYHHSYEHGDPIINPGTFSANSYVRGAHKLDHDITVDGFYTNYNDGGTIKVGYVEVTPPDMQFYIWQVGEEMDVEIIPVELVASKYATLGVEGVALLNFGHANSIFLVTGFSAGLRDGVSLIDRNLIEPIAATASEADTVFGLGMKAGMTGWQSGDATYFYTANGGMYNGTTTYIHENSTIAPVMNFYLYHSQNLSLERGIGDAKVRVQVLIPDGPLDYRIKYIDFLITMRTMLYPEYWIEAAVTPGEEFELFAPAPSTDITNKSKFSAYFALYMDDFNKSIYSPNNSVTTFDYFSSRHTLVSRTDWDGAPYPFPAGTTITMIDNVRKKYYYYIVSAADVSAGKYMYDLLKFTEMGSDDKLFDEPGTNFKCWYQSQDIVYENYIFHVDFKGATVPDIENHSLLMEIQDVQTVIVAGNPQEQRKTLLTVYGSMMEPARYSVYDVVAKLAVDGETNPMTVYLGRSFELLLNTNYKQGMAGNKTVYNTQAFKNKMGIKISIYNSSGKLLNADDLLGIKLIFAGKEYYPRVDGSIRMSVADKLTNVLSRITIDTTNNSSLPSGTYKIVVEAFGSPDGICYGWEKPEEGYIYVDIINAKYGLKVSTDDESKIINKETWENLNGEKEIEITVDYDAQFLDPIITVSLERRDYEENGVYSTKYGLVNLKDYFLEDLQEMKEATVLTGMLGVTATINYDIESLTDQPVTATISFDTLGITITNNGGNDSYVFTENGTFTFEFEDEFENSGTAEAKVSWINQLEGKYKYEYFVTDSPSTTNKVFLTLTPKEGPNLKTGTYKLVFKLYDGVTYIGEAYEYFIIK